MKTSADDASLQWQEGEQTHQMRWHSEQGAPAPKRVVIADDQLPADTAYRLACEGTALLWQGDFQNAKQLLQALARRIDRPAGKSKKKAVTDLALPTPTNELPAAAFHRHRQAQAHRARVLGMLLITINSDYSIALKRAPIVHTACVEAYGSATKDGLAFVISLRELLGLIGAHQWRKSGVTIASLDASITPHYGVYSPLRGEYLDLIAKAPLPAQITAANGIAFDIGTGTGVIACLLAKRGVKKIIATDQDERALSCARENIDKLGYQQQIELRKTDLFPAAPADLIVCNPPWLPVRPNTPIENAIYDPESRMLRGFLNGLVAHLAPQGEAWLIMSDFAEHLGLRNKDALWNWITESGLHVVGKMDIKPQHGKAADTTDPLHAARAAEVTSLWRLRAQAI
jgi:methylase of polypeptide subunit release factors